MTYKITYSTSIYGNFIIYYLGCLKSIYCLPYRHFVIHTTKESKELFYKIANQYSINLDNVDFIVHESPKSIWDCSWWRYETLQMNYDIVHIIDSDTVCTGINKYYDSWYLDYPNLDFFMMHIHKRHYDFMAGLCSFNISNINKNIINLIINQIFKCANTYYGYDEIKLWQITRPFFKLKGLLYTIKKDDKNIQDFESYKIITSKRNDVYLSVSDIDIFKPFIKNNRTVVQVDGKIYDAFKKHSR